MIRRLPQPFKTLYVAMFAVFLVGFAVVAIADRPAWMSSVVIPFGVLGALAGLVLATDFRGNATENARLLREEKPMGIDHSGSPLASVRGIRLLGAGIAVVGLFFCAVVPFLE